MTDQPTKSTLRRMLKERRAAISTVEAAAAASRICAHLEPLLRDRGRIAGFSSTQNEVDLSHLYERLLAGGKNLCFPRVEGPGAMVFAEVATLDDLAEGAYGIAEPTGPAIPTENIEVFLVPGLGFDRHGGRLGFGGGYYDRALADRREVTKNIPLFVGIGYSCQVLDTDLPIDEWDVRLDLLVTEDGALDIS